MANLNCPHCGAEVQAEQVYCPHCTRALRLEAPEPATVEVYRRTGNRALGWVVGIGLVGVCGVMVLPAIFIPALTERRGGGPAMKTACLSNMKQVATAAMIYQADWDDRNFPSAATYQAELAPYTKNASLFYCPFDGKPYATNAKMVKVEAKKVKDPATTVYFFEANAGVIDFPHSGMGNVAFVDGHAKAVKLGAKLNYQP